MIAPDQAPQPARPTAAGVPSFAPQETEPARRGMIFGALGAIFAVVVLAGVMLVRSHRQADARQLNQELAPDAYAQSLVFSQLAMSQSTSLSGGTSTFLDGAVRNSGQQTVTAATLQVLFRNDLGLTPQIETVPLSLVRMREPYIDTEPVSAAPLKPGDEVEFRLIFESIPDNWNQQMPELRVVQVGKH